MRWRILLQQLLCSGKFKHHLIQMFEKQSNTVRNTENKNLSVDMKLTCGVSSDSLLREQRSWQKVAAAAAW